jgi:AcrR family transcriptional regulator
MQGVPVMSRTVDAQAHAVRRDAFVDAAQRLMQAKGYEQMSIRDVLDEVGASRGAFYHYFDSKVELLEAVVIRIVDTALASAAPVVDDPALDAVGKLEGLFGGMAQWKMERSELMLAVTRVWLSDENTLMRDKMWRHLMLRLVPPLAEIIRQGNEEGVFSVTSPCETARVLVALIHGLNDTAVRLFLECNENNVTLTEVEELAGAHVEAMERILGLPAGTLHLIDRRVLEEWYQ